MYELFCEAAEDYLARRSGDALEGRERAYRGRGKEQQPRLQALAAGQRPETVGALTLEQRQLLNLKGRVTDLEVKSARLSGPGQAPREHERLWTKIAAAGARKLPGKKWQRWWGWAGPPPREELRELRRGLQGVADDLARQQRRQRGADFRDWANESWRKAQGKIFEWCKEERKGGGATLLRRQDGHFTGNIQEMDAALHRAWDPIMRMYADREEPEWEPFHRRFGQYVAAHPMECDDLSGASLRPVLGRMGGRQAGGMEGWCGS